MASEYRTLRVPAATGQPSSFTFAFGSCIIQGRAAPALNVARGAQPAFFALLGDLGYKDNAAAYPNTQNYDGYLALFRGILARPEMAALLNQTPFYGVQDDHDYGQDDAWRDTIKPYAAQAYADLIPGAIWPGPNYRRWSIGQAEFFLLDNRRFRDPPTPPFENGVYRSNLGTTQRTWLLDGLTSSTARVKIVLLPMTMAWYFSTAEKNAIVNRIASSVPGTVIFCAGDKHAGGFVRYSARVWEMLASPLQNPSKHLTPNRPGVVWTEGGTGRALSNVVGLVNVDTLTTQTVTLRLLKETGVELHREVVPIA